MAVVLIIYVKIKVTHYNNVTNATRAPEGTVSYSCTRHDELLLVLFCWCCYLGSGELGASFCLSLIWLDLHRISSDTSENLVYLFVHFFVQLHTEI